MAGMPGAEAARHSATASMDIKEAVNAAAPRGAKAKMPRDNAGRVVGGARHLSPSLGERILSLRLLDRAVFLRELLPQDLKLEIDHLDRVQSMRVAEYLSAVVGRAHGRQIEQPGSQCLGRRVEAEPIQNTRCTIMALVQYGRFGRHARGRLP